MPSVLQAASPFFILRVSSRSSSFKPVRGVSASRVALLGRVRVASRYAQDSQSFKLPHGVSGGILPLALRCPDLKINDLD